MVRSGSVARTLETGAYSQVAGGQRTIPRETLNSLPSE